MLKWIADWWKGQQRKVDLQILWPSCKKHASDLETARRVFITHMGTDPAWEGMTEEELAEFVRTKLV